jgi:fatty acid amide hydrolase
MVKFLNLLFGILKKLALGYLAAHYIYKIIKSLKDWKSKNYWKNQANIYLKERNNIIKQFLNDYSNNIEKERLEYIVKLTVSELAEKIKNKEITSYETVLAFSLRTATIGKDLNLIADVNFKQALEEARERDNQLNEGSVIGPLHGVPISIKDHINVKGFRTTLGISSLYYNTAKEDSYIIKVLRSLGAVPFIKGNLPQGMNCIEASNLLYGSCINPWNKDKSTGGSSGGDAGLVAADCAPLALGCDIGGSIRIPASFCGIYGFKPTSSRISIKDVPNHVAKIPSVYPNYNLVIGPLGKSVDDMVLMCRCLYGSFPNDPFVKENKFKEVEDRKLTIGYFYDYPLFQPAQIIKSSVDEIVVKLRQDGHDVKVFDISKFHEMVYLGLELMFNMGCMEELEEELRGEDLDPIYDNYKYYSTLNPFKKFFLKYYYNLIGEKRLAAYLSASRLNKEEFFKKSTELRKLKDEVIDYMLSSKFDAIICPTYSLPACKTADTSSLPKTNFEVFASIVDMPSAVVPLKFIENIDEIYTDDYNDSLTKLINENLQTSKGLPIGLQIMTLPNNDELCLYTMKLIDNLNKN